MGKENFPIKLFNEIGWALSTHMLVSDCSLQVLGGSEGGKMIRTNMIIKQIAGIDTVYCRLRNTMLCWQSINTFICLLLPNSQFSPVTYPGQMQRYPLTVNPFRQVALRKQGLLEHAF